MRPNLFLCKAIDHDLIIFLKGEGHIYGFVHINA